MKKLKLIDLFAGCGGLTEGFEQTGLFRTVACVEWERTACATLVKRLRDKWNYSDAEKRVLRFDIQRSRELIKGWHNDPNYASGYGLENLVTESNGIDLIIGGPPCQAYSIAGRIRDEHGMRYDYRNYLFESYLEIVKHFRPLMIIFENVPGMLSAKPGGISISERVRRGFRAAGYEIISDLRLKALIDFVPFGIPQRRSRVILVGLQMANFGGDAQKKLFLFYDRILANYKTRKKATVREAFKGLPAFYPADNEYLINGKRFSHKPYNSDFLNHVPRYHNRRDIKIFHDLASDIKSGKNHYTSIEALHRLYRERTGRASNVHKYYVLHLAEPSNTIPAHLYKDGLRHIHPDPRQARSITVREAARLQTFDDDYEILGSMGEQYKMVGNAVPPLFAKILANAIYEFIKICKVPKGGTNVKRDIVCTKAI